MYISEYVAIYLFICVSNLFNLIYTVCRIDIIYVHIYLYTCAYTDPCVCVCVCVCVDFMQRCPNSVLLFRLKHSVSEGVVSSTCLFLIILKQELFTCTHTSRNNSVGERCS
jgi:hypothetical protein